MSDCIPMPPTFARLDDWLGVWSMEPFAAQALLAAVQTIDWPAHLSRAQAMPRVEGVAETVEANGKRVAVVTIAGTMMKSRSSTGGTSTIDARRQVRAAAADDQVGGILLRIDSPGGTVAGTDALASEVRAARRSKPVFAQVEDVGASAAYWVASQAAKVYAGTPTALVGSIGTLMVVRKESAGGLAVFRSGPHKGAGVDGELTEDQAAHLQSLVDGWQAEFSRAVAAGRRLDEARMGEVATGAAWLAGRAKELGLIDGVQPVERTLDQLSRTR